MELNADFGKRASAHAEAMPWSLSPMPGVERKMLDRIGDEVARATTIVRYAPGSAFSPHVHSGGEEFLVLDGVFQDEHGDYPAGSYIRNPPQSSHTPGSEPGCKILVKLWQFDPDDRTDVRLQSSDIHWQDDTDRRGVSCAHLHSDVREVVQLERWAPNSEIFFEEVGGVEIFVLDGEFIEENERFSKDSWLRLPVGYTMRTFTGSDGATVWIKTGHLKNILPV
ncbi:MAG: anti-sigma factor ChrR (cupin superfamily) [Parasphingorhabdus sp.]|jgi:anti-sigma factor ChrR (cupin superfamily)